MIEALSLMWLIMKFSFIASISIIIITYLTDKKNETSKKNNDFTVQSISQDA